MVLGRRVPATLRQRLRAAVWPRAGWSRASRYVWTRLKRMQGTPHSIAAGFASGAASSMTPFLGFHFLISFALAFLVRGSILASAVGTLVGNPWTFPFIWVATYRLGCQILGRHASHSPLFPMSFSKLWESVHRLLLPMAVGSIPFAIAAWAIFYLVVLQLIRTFRARRHAVLARRQAGRALSRPPTPAEATSSPPI